jgi:magnesium transporter
MLAAGAGLMVWLAAVLMDGDTTVAWVAAFALFGTVCLGTLFGVLTPLALARLKVDPAVATSPFITTVNDVLGSSLIIFFCWVIF